MKETLPCSVTLPLAGITMFNPPKLAAEPIKPMFPAEEPLFKRLIPLIPEGLPVPESVKVRLVTVTDEPEGLFTRTCTTGKLEAPGSWVELEGAEGPVDTITVTAVGVKVGVMVEVAVRVSVGVEVAIAMVIVAAL